MVALSAGEPAADSGVVRVVWLGAVSEGERVPRPRASAASPLPHADGARRAADHRLILDPNPIHISNTFACTTISKDRRISITIPIQPTNTNQIPRTLSDCRFCTVFIILDFACCLKMNHTYLVH